jgi:hypothetical protein
LLAAGRPAGFPGDAQTRIPGIVFYGEELLSGWVLRQIPDSEEAVAAAEPRLWTCFSPASPRQRHL